MRDLLKVFNFKQIGVIAYCIGQKINSLINLYGKNIHNEEIMGKSRNYFVQIV